jgi:hypothetical protein
MNEPDYVAEARRRWEEARSISKEDPAGAIRAFLDARRLLLQGNLPDGASAMVMDAVSVARSIGNKMLALRLCRLAWADDPTWPGPSSTEALVSTEIANAYAKEGALAKAVLYYRRAARKHRRAARMLQSIDPDASSIELGFAACAWERAVPLAAALRVPRI